MHLYNEWLPKEVGDKAASLEHQRFHQFTETMEQLVGVDSETAGAEVELKWVSIATSFINTRSDFAEADVERLSRTALLAFSRLTKNLAAQRRWAVFLTLLLRRYKKTLSITIPWRPLYDLFCSLHLSSEEVSYSGAVKVHHMMALARLIQRSRSFFPSGAAAEIWEEIKPHFLDLAHDDALQGAALLSLFMPTKRALSHAAERDPSATWSVWVGEWFALWAAVPHCDAWNKEWMELIGRCVSDLPPGAVDWEPFLPNLFSFYLNWLELPIGLAQGSAPVRRPASRQYRRVFRESSRKTVATSAARSLVFSLGGGSSCQDRLKLLVDLIEPYFHPSNGGAWTRALGYFMRGSVKMFYKRLAREKRSAGMGGGSGAGPPPVRGPLTPSERAAFVSALLRTVELAQFSKSNSVAVLAAVSLRELSWAEPKLVLPLVISRFQVAMETATATHQLEAALSALGNCVRTLLLHSAAEGAGGQEPMEEEGAGHADRAKPADVAVQLSRGRELLASTMFDILPGIDANDPPKTMATMSALRAILCSVGSIADVAEGGGGALPIDWSMWLDAFLTRLITLVQNLEPPAHDNAQPATQTGTFLVESDASYTVFGTVMDLIFARATPSLYQQVLRRIAKFVTSTVAPGAVYEVGEVCCSAVYARPQDAMSALLVPLMAKVAEALQGTPTTGFAGSFSPSADSKKFPELSPAMETSVSFLVRILGFSICYAGPALLPHKAEVINVLTAAFNAPSTKVYEAAGILLTSLLKTLTSYYQLDQYRLVSSVPNSGGLEAWASKEGMGRPAPGSGPAWHMPSTAEIAFAHELLEAHFTGAIEDLRSICARTPAAEGSSGSLWDREQLRVVLTRLRSSLHGIRTCLPDFKWEVGGGSGSGSGTSEAAAWFNVVGSMGASVQPRVTREDAAEVLHVAAEFMLTHRSDDTINAKLLLSVMDAVANYGVLEYRESMRGKSIVNEAEGQLGLRAADGVGYEKPRFLLVERASLQLMWRASQAGYRQYGMEGGSFCTLPTPPALRMMAADLLSFATSRYKAIRSAALSPLEGALNRHPSLVTDCIHPLSLKLTTVGGDKEAAIGACNVYNSRPLMRRIAQDWSALASFISAILQSGHQDDATAQKSIGETFLYCAARFTSCPVPRPNSSPTFAEVITALLTGEALGGAQAGATHWRYTLMAYCFLLLLVLPQPDSPSLAGEDLLKSVTEHFLRNLGSDQPLIRAVSAVASFALLPRLPEQPKQPLPEAMEEDVAGAAGGAGGTQDLSGAIAALSSDPAIAARVIQNLGYDHRVDNKDGGRGGSTSQGSQTIMTILYLLTDWLNWPSTKPRLTEAATGGFSVVNATLFQRLVGVGGATVLEGLREPLKEAISKTTERGSQCISAEAIAGFLRAGGPAVWRAWRDWLQPLLLAALAQSTVDSMGDWAAGLRFACTGLGPEGKVSPPFRMAVLEAASTPLPDYTPAAQQSKRLTYISACVGEMSPELQATESHGEMQFLLSLVEQLQGQLEHPALQVREGVGSLLATAVAKLPREPIAGQWLGQSAATASLFSEARSKAARIQQMGSRASGSAGSDEPAGSLGGGSSASDEVGKAAMRWMESAMFFLISSIKAGDDVAVTDALVELLEPILSVQETVDQDFSLLAKRALAYAKYMQLQPPAIHRIAEILINASTSHSWHTRGAALNFMQAFCYRNAFVIVPADLSALRETVVKLLEDPQIEVREVASQTLAGLLRGAQEEWVESVRAQCLNAAKANQPAAGGKRQRAKADAPSPSLAPAAATVPQRHGPILGLSSFVLSTPYTIPSWLPSLLMVLAKSADEPQPIQGTVSKTIGDFQRTHADTWEMDRAAFTEEQLEVLVNMQAAPSYFA